MKYRFMYECWY